MAKDNKYDENELFSSMDNPSDDDKTPVRRKRPLSPSLGVLTGDTKPTKMLDALKAKAQEMELALIHEREKFQLEKEELIEKLSDSNSPIVLTMPVTKQNVNFELKRIDHSLIDVSTENERIQEFLDEISLRDILPSIKKVGQQKPGMVRPKKGGRYELIEGSRRLACARLADIEYLALVGDVPEADIRHVSVIENKQRDVSAYEKAKFYEKQIANNEYSTWTQLAAAKGISEGGMMRYKKAAELESIYIKILPSPSDMTLSYAEGVWKVCKKGTPEQQNRLNKQAKKLLDDRQNCLIEGREPLDAEGVWKTLKSSIRVKQVEAPTKGRPKKYNSKDGRSSLKYSLTSSGSTKLELQGVDKEKLDKIMEYLKGTLKLE